MSTNFHSVEFCRPEVIFEVRVTEAFGRLGQSVVMLFEGRVTEALGRLGQSVVM